jgi:hypothetical protein
MCSTVVADRRQEEEIEAAAVVATMLVGVKRRWGGSVRNHIVKNRKRHEIHEQIMRGYFNDSPLYEDEIFRRRYVRQTVNLFLP